MKELLKQWKKIEFGTCLWLLRSLRAIDLVFTFGQTSIIKSMPINKIQHSLFISKLEKWEAGNCYIRKLEVGKLRT